MTPSRRSIQVGPLLLVPALLAAAAACSQAPARTGVVLVSIDTLRMDALGSYGCPRPTSPRIDRFLDEGVRFQRAYAPEPHTLPSHVSLLTSLHPLAHGVEAKLQGGRALARHLPTLATELNARGYATAAFINGGFLHPRFGLGRGFDVYDYFSDIEASEGPAPSATGRSAAETNAAALAWLDELPDDRPFFLFVHYFDVHSDWGVLPYESPEEYQALFESRFQPLDGGVKSTALFRRVNAGELVLGRRQVDGMRALYDAGVRYTDDRFGELVDGLRERELYDESLVVLVADHGEEFLEHQRLLHTQLYEECMRVPFGLKFPRSSELGDSAGLEPEAPVHHTDLPPTVLDLLGLPVPVPMAGRSLLPLIRGVRGEADWPERPTVLYSSLTGELAMIDGRWKLVYDPGAARTELYDLERDPGEETDVAPKRPREVATHLRRLLAWRTDLAKPFEDSPPATVELDQETLQQLRALGYGH